MIRGNKIVAASCWLPSPSQSVDSKFGTRHRAALGVSEQSDCVVLVVSEETGRRLKTRLSAQQTASLEERYKEKAQWRPTECEKLLEGLNALGPELSTEQVSRWFDNKRRYVKKQQARARAAPTASSCPPSSSSSTAWPRAP